MISKSQNKKGAEALESWEEDMNDVSGPFGLMYAVLFPGRKKSGNETGFDPLSSLLVSVSNSVLEGVSLRPRLNVRNGYIVS